MKGRKKPGKFQTFIFFLLFIFLFFLVFTLGVIVGKGLDGTGQQLSKPLDVDYKTLLVSTKGTVMKFIGRYTGQSPPGTENVGEKTPQRAQKSPKQIAVKEEELKSEVKSGAKQEPKPKPKAAAPPKEKKEVKKTAQTEPEKKKNYISKMDYNIPDFPKTDPGGKYTVQLGSFQSMETAYKFEKVLSQQGYPSFVIKAVIPNKGTWYRVRVGTFNDKDKARQYGEKLKKKENLVYMQITLNN